MTEESRRPVAPVSGTEVPRFAGPGTFAQLPRADQVSAYDVAIVGVPFDSGTSFRPGARFGPIEVCTSSRHLRPAYHRELGVSPCDTVQVVDAGDIACTPFSIPEAVAQVEPQAREIAVSTP